MLRRFRFSLRTAVLASLFLPCAVIVWLHREPWVQVLTMPHDAVGHSMQFSAESTQFGCMIEKPGHQGFQWLQADLERRTFAVGALDPRALPKGIQPPPAAYLELPSGLVWGKSQHEWLAVSAEYGKHPELWDRRNLSRISLKWLPVYDADLMVLSPCGTRLLHRKSLWDLKAQKSMPLPELPLPFELRSGFFSPLGMWFVGTEPRLLLDARTGAAVKLDVPDPRRWTIADEKVFAPDDQGFIAREFTGALKLFRFQGNTAIEQCAFSNLPEGDVRVRFLPNPDMVFLELADVTEIRSTKDGSVVEALAGKWNWTHTLPDALVLESAGAAILLDPGRKRRDFTGQFLTRSPDGRTILMCNIKGTTGTVEAWDSEGRFIRDCIDFSSPQAFVGQAVYSPDGERLAVGRWDEKIAVFEKRHDERWWGILTLPVLWLGVVTFLLLVWSFLRDRR